MPSFSTRNGSYHLFVVSIIENGSLGSELSKSHRGHSLWLFLGIFLLLVLATVLAMSGYFTLIYLLFYHFDPWQLAVLYDCLVWAGTAFATFVIVAILITTTISTPILYYLTIGYPKIVSVALAFTVFFCAVNGVITYVATLVFPAEYQRPILSDGSGLCSYIHCAFWTLQRLLQHIVVVGLSPLALYLIWLCINTANALCHRGNVHKSSVHKFPNMSMANNFTKTQNRRRLEMSLLPPIRQSPRASLHLSADIVSLRSAVGCSFFEPFTSDHVVGVQYAVLFGIGFAVLWALKMPSNRVTVEVMEQGHSFEAFYLWLLCYTATAKFVLKKLAKRIDEVRLKHDERNNVLSLEYLVEWYCSVVYFAWFRINIVYHVPPWRLFAVVFAVHLGSEAVQSVTRFSSGYFRFNRKIQELLASRDTDSFCNRWLQRIWSGDSDLMEWRNRNALDVTARLFASLLVAALQAVLIAVDGEKRFAADYGVDSEHSYWRGVEYAAFLTVAELVYFFALWLYHWTTNRYDLFSPFTLYAMGMGKGHRVTMLLTFVCVIVPSFFQ